MHARASFLFAGLLAAMPAIPFTAGAQGTFEGVVTFQVSAGQSGAQTMQYSVKGNKVRMDISAGGMNMFTLYDGSTRTIDMVVPMRQMYMERSADDMPAAADSAAANAKISWTGKKETIAGYECEHATITDDQGQATDVCLAKGLGSFVSMGGGMGGRGGRGRGMTMGSGWEGHIGQMFPLKVMRGNQVEMEATSIEKKTLDASLFTIPDGFNKMSMPMGGGGRGGPR